MSLWRHIVRGLQALGNRKAADRNIDDEVTHYIEEATADLEASGLSPEEARRRVQLEIGNRVVVRETVRGYGWENVIEETFADVRHAFRRLRHDSIFAATVAVTLALGIGASTAIFSILNPVLFQTLPYPEPQNLMMIWDHQSGTGMDVTFGTYLEVLERSRSFESFTVMKPAQVTLTGVGEPERLDGQYVSADYFRTLGLRPAIGRDFQRSDDVPRAPVVTILSDGLWHRRFSGDPGIIGRPILINGTPVTVIGILPRGFENMLSPSAEIWAALQYDPSLPVTGREWGHHLKMVGRLRSGVRLDKAAAELEDIAGATVPQFSRPEHASLKHGFITRRLQDDLTRTVRPMLYALLGAVTLLLAIVCVNVTNLLLARGAERRADLAVRAALGASRWRLVRQLVAETLPLAAIGGILGVLLANASVDALVALGPPTLLRLSSIDVNASALAFAFGLTTLIGLTVGIIPALHGAGADLYGSMQQRSVRFAPGQRTTRRTLVIVQVALAVVLLVGSGLLLRSLQRLFAVPPGFNPGNLLTMQVPVAGAQFRKAGATERFYAQALEAVRQVPGVTDAAFSSQLPLTGDEDIWGVHFEAVPEAAKNETHDGYRFAVSPDYFEAMSIPLRAGRVLNAQDTAGSPMAAVINESFARRRLPGLNPIGQRLHIGPNTGPWFSVVGVVADVKQTSLAFNPADAVYVSTAQWRFEDMTRWLVVRGQGNVAALTPAVKRAVWSVDKNQPIVRIATMAERVNVSAAERSLALRLFESFGIVALVLAAIGTYSLLSGGVVERTREIGLRTALGASRGSVIAMVLGQGITLVGIGVAFGLIGAAITSSALETLLYGVSRLDFITYVGVVVLLAIVSAIACWIPAWRAAQINPCIALKLE